MKILILAIALVSSSLMAQTIHEVIKPTERSSGKLFSSESNGNGVCKYLGFEKALKNSKKLLVDYYIYYGPNLVVPVYKELDSIVLDENGEFEENIYGTVLVSIKCIGV